MGQEPAAGAPGYAAAGRRGATREPPIPVELLARVYARLRAGEGARRADRLRGHARRQRSSCSRPIRPPRTIVRARKRWFSVDEYQDTNPLQERLLELWAGDSPDVCVVGDEDQTIYTFTGAIERVPAGTSPGATRGRRVVELTENYRSSPEILGLANRLLAVDRAARSVLTRDAAVGPGADALARLPIRRPSWPASSRGIRARIREGVAPAEIAVLVRLNAQLPPIEAALTTGGDPVRRPRRPVLRAPGRPGRDPGDPADRARRRRAATSPAAIQAVFASTFGYDPDAPRRRARGARAGRRPGRHPGDRRRLRRWVRSAIRSRPAPRACSPSSAAGTRAERANVARRRDPARRSTGPRASSGTRSSCPASRRGRCRSPRPPATRRRSTRSAGSCTSGSPGRAATWRSRGRPGGVARAAARAVAGRRASWPSSASAPTGAVRSRRPRPGHAEGAGGSRAGVRGRLRGAPELALRARPGGRRAGLRRRP